MALMSILLFFSIPKLDISLFSNDNRNFSSRILLSVRALKENAQREKKQYILYVDMDNNQIWTACEASSEENKKENQKENLYNLSDGLRLLDVEFPETEKKSSGIAEIHFYPQGYSDKALIHVEDKEDRRNTYRIEPFLPQVKIYDRYFEF